MYNKSHLTLKMPSMNNCEILILYTVHMEFGSENLTICYCVQFCKMREDKPLFCHFWHKFLLFFQCSYLL